MGFFATIGRGWALSKLSFAVVRKDPELMLYTFLSGLMVLATVVVAALPGVLEQEWAVTIVDETTEPTPAYLAWIFATYMLGSIFVVFWNSAIVASAHERLTGGDPTISTGIARAMQHLPAIIVWGLIAGTVGLLLRLVRSAVRESDNTALRIVGSILTYIAEAAWWIMTFFIVPMIIIEGKGVRDGLRDSKRLFFSTWGENITSGMGIGLITLLFIILSALVGAVLVMAGLVVPGIIVAVLLVALAVLWGQTAEVVAKAALYIFATTGKMPSLAEGIEQTVGWQPITGWNPDGTVRRG